ncbi:Inner membrane lipoprotein YiaD precursor [Phocoenobacter uteri]|uniref:Inner membrane lipoprotein YiaD n=1 Tax=Phocoenobacter uteri TaxID=146806 RepID=A0A379CBV3_9PAST|nr:OmpA family protein [Phocoenobacter uteri]MDG6881164.1 hypothetical protein [Phocoenobacter uteri]SUB59186.1 Inner membrane lipoprotein YiaD precursor [Phocoenobacter uteri]
MKKTLVTIAIATTLAGCQLTPQQETALGALGGAVAGGVIGHQFNHKNGRYVGAVLGALAGGGITYYMTQQQQDLEKVLEKSGISVTRINDSTIKLNIPSDITFAVNKAQLSQGAMNSLSAVANVLNKYKATAIHVLGFTDSTGSDSYNLTLSQKRAESAANFLASRGVVAGRIVATGYGESHTIANNDTEQGRAMNRRAEIYIRAIEKGNEQSAYSPIY